MLTSWHNICQSTFYTLQGEICESVIIWDLSDFIPRYSVSVTIVSKENLTGIILNLRYSTSVPPIIQCKFQCLLFYLCTTFNSVFISMFFILPLYHIQYSVNLNARYSTSVPPTIQCKSQCLLSYLCTTYNTAYTIYRSVI